MTKDFIFQMYNIEQIKEEKFDDGIYFKIEKVRDKTDKENFDVKRTLEDGANNARSSECFDDSNLMMGFILKLKKLEVRLIKKTLM